MLKIKKGVVIVKGPKLVLQRNEFFYETEKQRDEHVEAMKNQGWEDMSGSNKKIRHRVAAENEGYEWFACFQINDKY